MWVKMLSGHERELHLYLLPWLLGPGQHIVYMHIFMYTYKYIMYIRFLLVSIYLLWFLTWTDNVVFLDQNIKIDRFPGTTMDLRKQLSSVPYFYSFSSTNQQEVEDKKSILMQVASLGCLALANMMLLNCERNGATRPTARWRCSTGRW